MSYFDENYTGGDGSDNESDSKSSVSDSDIETEKDDLENVGLEEEEILGSDDEEEVDEIDDEDEDEDGGTKAKGIEGLSPQDNDQEEEDDDEEEETGTKIKKIPKVSKINDDLDDDDDDDDPVGDVYLKKFDKEINDNYLVNNHPESCSLNYDEILAMTKIVRDKSGIIIDDLHKTIPYLTKYEKARILGQRAKQINSGATAFVKAPEKVIDGYLIAELELQEKRVPFIIRRPLPNGGSEYWKVSDLENISF
jgi:DNA-directed RNA polymerase I, II, and III subunit RPABC2